MALRGWRIGLLTGPCAKPSDPATPAVSLPPERGLARGEAELRGDAVPSRAWDRGEPNGNLCLLPSSSPTPPTAPPATRSTSPPAH